MAEKVAIVGMAQTKYEERKRGQSYPELVYEVTSKVLETTGMGIEDIDNIVTASQDFWDGRTISNVAINEAVGAFMKPESKVASDGILAVLYAYIRILSGSYDTASVVSHCKMSEGSRGLIENCMFDPLYQRILGLDDISTSALQAKRYMCKYGITEEQCAKVSVKNHRNAQKNPYAQMPLAISVDDVLKSEMLSDPIRVLDSAPISDGACALILANEEKAKEITDNPVWINGIGSYVDAYYLGDRDLADMASLELAAEKAYRMAGIEDPLKEIDVAEISDNYSYQELMWTEGLGFCKRGGGGKLIDEGITQMEGDLPVNPSGGILSGNPITVAGLIRVAEAALQVRGEAGERQVPNVKTALAHGTSGPCGQGHCVIILGR